MGICFNSLQLSAPKDTTQRLLSKGFEDCDSDDWGLTPQLFSFRPFVLATDKQHLSDYQEEMEQIWTNWIEGAQADDQSVSQLTIEFESEGIPPLRTIQALIEWLQQEELNFDLRYRYRQENQSWQGELNAHNPQLH